MPTEVGEVSIQGRVCASVGASAIAAIVTNPLEVLKSRLQAQLSEGTTSEAVRTPAVSALVRSEAHGATCTTFSPGGAFRVPVQTANVGPNSLGLLRQIISQEGVGALYRGLPPALLAAVPTVAIYLPMYDALRDRYQHLGSLAPLVAGTIARSCAVIVVAPLELLRTRAMSLSAADIARDAVLRGGKVTQTASPAAIMARGEGRGLLSMLWSASNLWRGLNATLMRDVPFTAIFWSMTEPMRAIILPHTTPQTTPAEIVVANATAAGVSGAVAAVITTPFDVIKTQQQIASGAEARGVWGTGRQIFERGGWNALFRGTTLRSVRAVPACAIVVSSYEVLKHYFAQPYFSEPADRRPCTPRSGFSVLQLWCSD